MEHKIGEIFEYNGEWYQCLESSSCRCDYCDYGEVGDCHKIACIHSERSDDKEVYFKKLKKVGEPFYTGFYCSWVQKYKLYENNATGEYPKCHFGADYVLIEIKQNKEDMGEKKTNFVEAIDALCKRYYMSDGVRIDFMSEVKEIINDKEKCNLKPFNLDAAKQGKPVCTRDGRKARIICFDRICGDDYYKIVACVTAFDGDFEEVLFYGIDGYIVDSQNPKDEDLMMLPEKKEGWVNVYKEESNNNERLIEQTIYQTRKDAFDNACPKGYITTTKINWEE